MMQHKIFLIFVMFGFFLIAILSSIGERLKSRNIVFEYKIRLKEQERIYLLKHAEVEKLKTELENCKLQNK